MKTKPIKLTKSDWTEIYYALQYKLTSKALDGRWIAQLNQIQRKIGPDGDDAIRLGVVPSRR